MLRMAKMPPPRCGGGAGAGAASARGQPLQHGPRREAARTEKRCLLRLGLLRVPREMFFPEQLAEIRIDGEQIVVGSGDERDLLEAAIGDRALDDQRSVQRVDRSLLRLELDLPQQLEILDRVLRDSGFVLLPAGPLKVAAVRDPVGGAHRHRGETREAHGPDDDSAHCFTSFDRRRSQRDDTAQAGAHQAARPARVPVSH